MTIRILLAALVPRPRELGAASGAWAPNEAVSVCRVKLGTAGLERLCCRLHAILKCSISVSTFPSHLSNQQVRRSP